MRADSHHHNVSPLSYINEKDRTLKLTHPKEVPQTRKYSRWARI